MKKLSAIVLTVIIVFLAGTADLPDRTAGNAVSFSISADAAETPSYGNVGYHCLKKNNVSGKLIIGDSRNCQMWNYKKGGASFASVWAGHYYKTQNSMYQINTANMISKMKNYAQGCIHTKGKCDIYIFATVNDYNGSGDYKRHAKNVFTLAETARSWSATYNGKKIKPTVHVVSLVGTKNKIGNSNIKKYNSYLKSMVNKSGKIKDFIDISKCLSGSNGGFLSDNIHFNNTTLKKIWAKM